jgi:hypothetical protein
MIIVLGLSLCFTLAYAAEPQVDIENLADPSIVALECTTACRRWSQGSEV